jgi:hypothetical protein
MAQRESPPPPGFFLLLLRSGARLAPPSHREIWRGRLESDLVNWWILVQRGELSRGAHAVFLLHFVNAIVGAFWMRFSRERVRRFLAGPVAVLCSLTLVLLATGVLSSGFRFTRTLFRLTDSPAEALRTDVLVMHVAPMTFALFIGMFLTAVGPRVTVCRRLPWWGYLFTKALLVLLVVPLLWTEAGGVIRSQFAPGSGAWAMTGVVYTLSAMFLFACALAWIFADQRRRCPECLHVLALPVTIGSWSSVLEPVSTELICEQGHGSLSVPESVLALPEKWTSLDASWRDLFVAPTP